MDTNYDIIIIGSGAAGLARLYMLAGIARKSLLLPKNLVERQQAPVALRIIRVFRLLMGTIL